MSTLTGVESRTSVCAPERAPFRPPLTPFPVKPKHYGINQFYLGILAESAACPRGDGAEEDAALTDLYRRRGALAIPAFLTLDDKLADPGGMRRELEQGRSDPDGGVDVVLVEGIGAAGPVAPLPANGEGEGERGRGATRSSACTECPAVARSDVELSPNQRGEDASRGTNAYIAWTTANSLNMTLISIISVIQKHTVVRRLGSRRTGWKEAKRPQAL
jgi:hypothetical protein